MAYCPICKDVESSSHSMFCYNHIGGWVESPERKQVEWDSDESYNKAVDAYVARVLTGTIVEVVTA
jgi:hypothetical protein